MMLLDADVLLLDLSYPTDAKFPTNRTALERISAEGLTAGVTSQALLETIGILSFNLSPQRLPRLAAQLCLQYRLCVVPDLNTHPTYADCTTQQLIAQMSRRMALGDAVQIASHAPGADCLMTWNARHFVGKLVIPALTPEEWLNQHYPARP